MSEYNEEKYLELFTDIAQKLGRIDGNMSSVLSQLADHNRRITVLEHHPSNSVTYKDEDNFKTEILRLLSKTLVISLVVISSLTGVAGIVSKILGLN